MDKKRLVLVIILVSLILPVFNQSVSSTDEAPWWDESWSFRQEINIPFDTKDEHSNYQPIDVNFEFENPCWAEDTTHHSIRVIYQEGGVFRELESQIYDLNFTREKIISDCSIVFLIPYYSSGKEKYYIYYDNSKKNPVDYDDHVSIDESYYKYEPVQGVSFNSWYYSINQNNYPVYAVIKKGNALGDSLSQEVTKLKKGSQNMLPKNAEQVASFSLDCWLGTLDEKRLISTREKLVFSDIIVDGNLMVKCIVASSSENDLLKTTNVYKYYYCPSDVHKRIYAQVKHEIPNGSQLKSENIDISFGGVNSGGIKSNIEKLNSGDIPPFLHFYSEKERVLTYEVDTDPEGIDWRKIIEKEDDCDIGSFSWLSVDYGEEEKAHGLILDSNEVVESGEDERDGVQILLYESNSIQLPNIDGKFSYIYLMRNKYEAGTAEDNILPDNYVVKYSADFFSTEVDGYKKVEEEALFYQKLSEFQPEVKNEYDINEEKTPTYKIEVYVDLSRSLKNKFRISKILLKNTYLSAELYKENKFIGLSRVGRIPLTEDYWIDWKNISIYRKTIFNNLEPGKYLVKVYINNLFLNNNNKFIGYEIIDLNENTSFAINCKNEGLIKLNAFDQYKRPIENVELRILEDETILSKRKSSEEGISLTGVPCRTAKNYEAQVFYKGFLIKEEEIKLGLIKSLLPLNIDLDIDLYNLKVKINNLNDNCELFLYSNDMVEEKKLEPKGNDEGYIFKDLIRSKYILEIKYDDFVVLEEIDLNENTSFNVSLKNIKIKVLDKWNLNPDAAVDMWLKTTSLKNNILVSPIKVENSTYFFEDLYPGKYTMKLTYKKDVYEKEININGNKNDFSIVFQALYNVTTNIYDSHGDLIRNAKIELKRENITLIKEVNNGISNFIVPPGKYICTIYNSDKVISRRKIDILSDRDMEIVTNKESNNLFYLFILFVPVLFVTGIYLYKKEKKFLFIKLIVLFLVISSLIFPWWSLSEEKKESNVQTESNLYVLPTEMITITSFDGYSSGEIASLDEDFISAVDFIPYLIFGGAIFLLINIFLEYKLYKKSSNLFLLLSSIFLVSCASLFYVAMSMFSKSLVGGLFGSSVLNIQSFGTSDYLEVPCCWGTDLGFYLILIGSIIITTLVLYQLVFYFRKKFKIIHIKEE